MRTSIWLLLALGCGSAPPPTAGAPGGAQQPPQQQPAQAQTVEIPAGALPPRGTLMLGEIHGTREIPAFVGRLMATAAAQGPVVLALEIPDDHTAAISAYLASDGSPAMRQKLVAGPWWHNAYQDGRRTVAMADLIETARALRAAGRSIDVVAMDQSGQGSEREEVMAQNVIAARRAHPDAALLVLAGNLHTSKRERPFRPGFAWMAMRVAAAGIPLISLNSRYADGTAWTCRDNFAEHCGVSFAAGRGPELGIRLEPTQNGQFDGWYGVGTVTASPPAARPELAQGLEAKIAAAATSPQATQAKARRAYDAKRYGECADLLASIPSPDGGAAYDHACCLALAGRKDEAFERLKYALGAGFQDLAHLEKDPDLASLRSDPRWPIKK